MPEKTTTIHSRESVALTALAWQRRGVGQSGIRSRMPGKKRSAFSGLALALSSVLLAGCLDGELTTTVHDDKSITVSSATHMARDFYDLFQTMPLMAEKMAAFADGLAEATEGTRSDLSSDVPSPSDEDFCFEGELDIGEETVTCRQEWSAELGPIRMSPPIPPEIASSELMQAQMAANEDIKATATEVQSGIIRVAIDLEGWKARAANFAETENLLNELGSGAAENGDQGADPDPMAAMAIMMSLFGQQMQTAYDDHAITLKVAGNEIVNTNGEAAGDGKSARLVIPMETLFEGQVDQVPDAFYADVRLTSCTLGLFCD